MRRSIFGAIFFPLQHFLENTEFLTEFHGIYLKPWKIVRNRSKWCKTASRWTGRSLEMWLSRYDTILKTQNFWRNSVEFAQKFNQHFLLFSECSKGPYLYSVSIWGTLEQRFTPNDTIWKTWNLPRNFFKSLKTDSKLFQMSKYTPPWVEDLWKCS